MNVDVCLLGFLALSADEIGQPAVGDDLAVLDDDDAAAWHGGGSVDELAHVSIPYIWL
jgi:hypothetical protein